MSKKSRTNKDEKHGVPSSFFVKHLLRRIPPRLGLVITLVLVVLFAVLMTSITGSKDASPVLARGNQNAPKQSSSTMTATATSTTVATAVATVTPIPSLTPTTAVRPPEWDYLEQNPTFELASVVSVNQTESNLNLNPYNGREDVDTFTVYGKPGQILRASTYVDPGTDTRMSLFSNGGELLGENDDRSPVDLGSTVNWKVQQEQWFYIQVRSSVPNMGGNYDFSILLEAPTPTPTHTPKPTNPPAATQSPSQTPVPPLVEPDAMEVNNNAAEAKDIVSGTTYPLSLPQGDVDFFRFFVNAGVHYRCSTYPKGVDTVLRILGASQTVITENDNRSVADVGSDAEWLSTYDGFVYVWVSPKVGIGYYELLCTGVEPTPPPSGGGGGGSGGGNIQPTSTPTPIFTPTATPIFTEIRFVAHVNPTSTPAVVTVIKVQVAYDANNDKIGSPNEGIENVSVRAVYLGRVVGWGLTDARGETTLTIMGSEIDRITIPLIGWERTVRAGTELTEPILIPPVNIPAVIPVEIPETD